MVVYLMNNLIHWNDVELEFVIKTYVNLLINPTLRFQQICF